MFKIQTLNKIDPVGLKNFPLDEYEIASEFSSPDAILVRSQSMHEMELPASLKAIARAGAGVNNIPVEKCSERGIVVFNTPGANADAVKELVLAALLLSSRGILQSVEWVKTIADRGDEIPDLIEAQKKNFAGNEIKGKTLAVIGLGAIGALIANAAQALGMDVVGYDPYISVKQAWRLSRNVRHAEGIEVLLSQADYVTVHIPQTPDTKGYINKDKLRMMKDGVRILNFSRGGLVNKDDLRAALESGKVKSYITDFPDKDVLTMKNVIAIPHLGASTAESETNCAVMAVAQVHNFLKNGNIVNSVNFPEAELERHGGPRLVIANRNIPNMVSQISSILAKKGINIANMLNKNKADIAYNLIDIDGAAPDDSLVQEFRSIDGVLTARLLP
ncbi:MAG: phosphoglycerate dehydrogenase [Bacteroidales bacterium]|jgi:D-3-phosphoglycerate dehydrogenase|nr:phosphoglycerate dehydrogenase [Bacteroidales bacterium]